MPGGCDGFGVFVFDGEVEVVVVVVLVVVVVVLVVVVVGVVVVVVVAQQDVVLVVVGVDGGGVPVPVLGVVVIGGGPTNLASQFSLRQSTNTPASLRQSTTFVTFVTASVARTRGARLTRTLG